LVPSPSAILHIRLADLNILLVSGRPAGSGFKKNGAPDMYAEHEESNPPCTHTAFRNAQVLKLEQRGSPT
jgi:hypothetical protein